MLENEVSGSLSMNIASQLAQFGAAKDSVRDLAKPSADNLNYLDLISGVGLDWGRKLKIRPEAVVEHEGRPLLYVLDAKSLLNLPESALPALRVKLASRGEPAWLAISKPGELSILSLGFDANLPPPIVIRPGDDAAGALIQDLAAGQYSTGQERATENAFRSMLFRLITSTCNTLLSTTSLKNDPDSVLSLVGRALFTRFLADRGLLAQQRLLGATQPEKLLSNVTSAIRVFRWLDKTFNGDLLPIRRGDYKQFFSDLGNDAVPVLHQLTNIMYRAPDGQLNIQETWGLVDFAYVPVGLLSEVYEQFAHEHGPLSSAAVGSQRASLARLESVHYTPYRVAKFMVDEAFPGIKTAEPHRAKVLDPAAGGGVFLVLAYRRLVAEYWRAKGRPGRAQLREILNKQIRGFDINESALKLAALGLYLTAIDLDPHPDSLAGLAFDPLMGFVLIHALSHHERHPNIFGSLGPAIGEEHRRTYDLVIGNPPWTSWKKSPPRGDPDINEVVEQNIRGIAGRRHQEFSGGENLASIAVNYQNADRVPDLPFVWQASEWAVKGGVIAFALHGRLLFKQSAPAIESRSALFQAIKVTGILNGSALRQENVWPNTDAPWCLLFAVNVVPVQEDAFYFISPELESSLNQSGLMRVDYTSAQPVQLAVLQSEPSILKVMFRGTAMDAAIIRRLSALPLPTLGQYWTENGLISSMGYKIAAHGTSHEWMVGIPNLTSSNRPRFMVRSQDLPRFVLLPVHRPRSPNIYKAPLVLFPAAVRPQRDKGGALLAEESMLFSASFVGYSCHGYSGDAGALAKYLYVLSYSSLLTYRALMTSAQFGIERDALLKEDIDNFPILPFENLTATQCEMASALADRIVAGDCPWLDLDNWVMGLYGLNSADLTVISDTLDVSAPFTQSRKRAQEPPGDREQVFVDEMNAVLQPIFRQLGTNIEVRRTRTECKSWRFVDILCGNTERPEWTSQWMQGVADEEGASRLFVRAKPGHLGVGILAQYRYWTKTRARLCALDVFRQHADHLMLEAGQ